MAKQVPKIVPQFKNEIKNNTHILTLNGVVASDEFDNTISYKFIENSLKDTDKDIVIKLSSAGGDAFEGINIYNYLKSLKNNITIEITSIAASAASLISMAADTIVMHTGANMMIHEASTLAFGNKSDIQKTLNALESVDTSIVDIYHERTGIDKAELSRMMANETWLTADEAVSNKFADKKRSNKEVSNMDKNQLVASLQQQQHLLAQMIENVSEGDDAQPQQNEPTSNDTVDERVATVENDIKSIKSRLDKLEGNNESNNTPPQQPQNKFNKFAF
ncbi:MULTISPECIES: head maturation protease, ClpP-related [unclassified Staphylococcus]|uniref:head maturation protease, ClpP-related n=1 Tax=unclassified Staphylococcus TaxID=91994 RepID=UPI0008A4C3A3|nr:MULTISPECIES: head maturation protease, ClpP-related [unclassified Staphylococcus]OFV05209.1 peptidase [Staphylococcus sp. HMSC12H08]OHR51739.1 peptidase [Staphylococcus sp. HMSC056D08]